MRRVLATAAAAAFLTLGHQIALAHDEKGVGDHSHVYLSKMKGMFFQTIRDGIAVFTEKTDFRKRSEDDLVAVDVLVRKTLLDDHSLPAVMTYAAGTGKRKRTGEFLLHRYGFLFGSFPDHHVFSFSLRKSTLENALFSFENDKETIKLNFSMAPNAQQDDAGNRGRR